MTEIIERVARAMCWQRQRRFRDASPCYLGICANSCTAPWDNHVLLGHDEDARAVLAAMREPTEAMLDAVDREEKISGHIHYDNMPADQAWPIMIDAALGGK